MSIGIYANWTGDLLATGATIAEARAKLTVLDCSPETAIGDDVCALTVLDFGEDGLRPYDASAGGGWQDYHLHLARRRFQKAAISP